MDLSRLGFWPLILAVDAGAGLYIGLHRHLVSTGGLLGRPFGAVVAFVVALTIVSAWVFLLARSRRARRWTALVDAAVLAWFALAGWHQLSDPQQTFLTLAAAAALVTNVLGGADAIFWLAPLFENANPLEVER